MVGKTATFFYVVNHEQNDQLTGGWDRQLVT